MEKQEQLQKPRSKDNDYYVKRAEELLDLLGLWCMNWRFFRMGRLNKDRLLSRLGMTFLRKNLCLLFQGTCFGQPIVLPPFRQAPSPISPSLSSRVSGA